MATEKQIGYIKALVTGMKFENVPYLNKSFDELGGVDEADHQRAIKHYNHNRQEWMLAALGINSYSVEWDLDATKAAYSARIAELENTDFSGMDNQQASALIDNLKRHRIAAK